MRSLRTVLAAVALAALAAPRPAAASVALGLGGDYLLDPESGELQLTLAVQGRLARYASLGVRFGGMYLEEPDRFGIPIDARLRLAGGGIYAEGLAGPWIIPDDDDSLRLHAAFGFGLYTRSVSFGVEVGWLDPTSMVGLRIAFPL